MSAIAACRDMRGNWLQTALHWYWLTPWQVLALIAAVAALGAAGVCMIDRHYLLRNRRRP